MKRDKRIEALDYHVETGEKQAEASGAHKEPLNMLNESNMVIAATGHMEEEHQPSIEELTK